MWLLVAVGCTSGVVGAVGSERSSASPPVELGSQPLEAPGCGAVDDDGRGVPIDEEVYPALSVDPALADAPWCIGAECGVGNAAPANPHHVKVPRGRATRDELVVFFTGTGGECDKYEVVPRLAASAGFRTVCLGYPDRGWEDACAASADPDCAEHVHEEAQYGVDASPDAVITRPNSIEGRLFALLSALSAEDPRWSEFLVDDQVRWDRVIGMGFSQGAGAVAFLSKDHALSRAILFSGGCNVLADGSLASWCDEPRATDVASTFLYFHAEEDGAATLTELADRWFGQEPVSVDAALPECGQRVVTTDRASPHPHGLVAWDPYMELDAGGWPVDGEVHLWSLLGR